MFPNLENFRLIDDTTLVYGNYGGLDYSAGQPGGSITGTPADVAPVDAYDALFYQHDLAYTQTSDPVELIPAHVAVVEGVVDLLRDALGTQQHGLWLF